MSLYSYKSRWKWDISNLIITNIILNTDEFQFFHQTFTIIWYISQCLFIYPHTYREKAIQKLTLDFKKSFLHTFFIVKFPEGVFLGWKRCQVSTEFTAGPWSVYVRVCVCVCACVYVNAFVYMSLSLFLCVCVCVCIHVYNAAPRPLDRWTGHYMQQPGGGEETGGGGGEGKELFFKCDTPT